MLPLFLHPSLLLHLPNRCWATPRRQQYDGQASCVASLGLNVWGFSRLPAWSRNGCISFLEIHSFTICSFPFNGPDQQGIWPLSILCSKTCGPRCQISRQARWLSSSFLLLFKPLPSRGSSLPYQRLRRGTLKDALSPIIQDPAFAILLSSTAVPNVVLPLLLRPDFITTAYPWCMLAHWYFSALCR